jgi:hypothetical protein
MLQELPKTIATLFARDQSFRVLTMDGTGWIDPYTGKVVPTPFGWEPEARKYLLAHQPWVSLKKKSMQELLLIRWQEYLRTNLAFVPNLRIFREGRWLNPYTGRWVTDIPLKDGQVTVQVAEDIARHLSECPEAQAGRMLENLQLEILAAKGPPPAPKAAPPRVAKVARPIGRLGTANPAAQAPAAAPAAAPAHSTGSGQANRVAKPLPGRRSTTDFHDMKRMMVKLLAKPPRLDNQQLVVHYEPHAPITRDLYDFIQIDKTHLLILAGNIAGQGPGVAMLAGMTLEEARKGAAKFRNLVEYIGVLNDSVRCDLYPGSSINLYACLLDTARNILTCVAAGHHPAALINPRAQNPLNQIKTSGSCLGVLTGEKFRKTLEPIILQLEPDDIFFLSTHGVYTTANPSDPEAGRCAVLGNVLVNIKKPLPKLIKDLINETKSQSRHLCEDLTVIALRVKETSWLFRMT